jgi:G3E family GTPase
MIERGDERIPVIVVSGFLGAGKTTLLGRMLSGAGGKRTAVIINEFGEISLDHLLVQNVQGTCLVLKNGCICCVIRSDLRQAIHDLIDMRNGPDGPLFDRIVIETTGLADPDPIAQTLTSDQMLVRQVRFSRVITVVDALHGALQIETEDACLNQIAMADQIVLTKTDLAGREQITAIASRLTSINPAASIIDAREWDGMWPELLKEASSSIQEAMTRTRLWNCRLSAFRPASESEASSDVWRHRSGIRSFHIRCAEEIDWTVFAVWLSALVHHYGDRILRIKGLLFAPGRSGAIAIHVVRYHIHEPVHLEEWPDNDRSTKIVFIVRGLDSVAVQRSFLAIVCGGMGPSLLGNPLGD